MKNLLYLWVLWTPAQLLLMHSFIAKHIFTSKIDVFFFLLSRFYIVSSSLCTFMCVPAAPVKGKPVYYSSNTHYCCWRHFQSLIDWIIWYGPQIPSDFSIWPKLNSPVLPDAPLQPRLTHAHTASVSAVACPHGRRNWKGRSSAKLRHSLVPLCSPQHHVSVPWRSGCGLEGAQPYILENLKPWSVAVAHLVHPWEWRWTAKAQIC